MIKKIVKQYRNKYNLIVKSTIYIVKITTQIVTFTIYIVKFCYNCLIKNCKMIL